MIRFLSVLILLFSFGQAYGQVIDCSLPTNAEDPICKNGGEPEPPTASIPEPGTLALFGLGIVAVGYMSRKRRK